MKSNIRRKLKTFMLGTDIELILSHKNKIAPFEGKKEDEFGRDGNINMINEIRVSPSSEPIDIIYNIRKVFKNKIKKHPKVLNYDWMAGSYKLERPISAHVHFGLSPKDIDFATANRIIGNYSAAISLAMEDKEEALSRRNNGDDQYGELNNWRIQPHGFEARQCSSFITSPFIALANFCMAKIVMFEILNNISFSPTERFSDNDYIEANQDKVRNNFDAVWSELSQMHLFPQYKEFLSIVPYLISRKLTWFPKNEDGTIQDLKTSWALVSNEIPLPPIKPETKLVLPKFKGNPIFENL